MPPQLLTLFSFTPRLFTTHTHTHTHIDPCEKRGSSQEGEHTLPTHTTAPIAYAMSIFVFAFYESRAQVALAVCWFPLPPFPLSSSTPSSSSMWFFFCPLFYDLGFMWALKQWLSVALLGHIQRVFYSAMKVFFILFLDIGKSLCHTYTYACARICVCVCI